MTSSCQTELSESFARFVYAAKLPLSFVEHPYFKEFAHIARPAWIPPSRYELSSKMLDNENQFANGEKAAKIDRAQVVGLMTDGWSNVKNKGLINFVATCPDPVYMATIDASRHSHTGSYMAELIAEKIEEIGKAKVLSLVTDNAAAMKRAWQILKFRFPRLLTYGCSAHSLDLLAKDICKLLWVKPVVEQATAVSKYIRNHQLPLAVFRQKGVEKYGKELAIFIQSPLVGNLSSFVSLDSYESGGHLKQLLWGSKCGAL